MSRLRRWSRDAPGPMPRDGLHRRWPLDLEAVPSVLSQVVEVERLWTSAPSPWRYVIQVVQLFIAIV